MQNSRLVNAVQSISGDLSLIFTMILTVHTRQLDNNATAQRVLAIFTIPSTIPSRLSSIKFYLACI